MAASERVGMAAYERVGMAAYEQVEVTEDFASKNWVLEAALRSWSM
jgi:hypothetical protein